MDEAELVRRAARGDIDAFGDLFGRYMTDIYRLACVVGHPRDEVEDLMQDTFLAAFEGIGRYRRQSSFKTWLVAVLLRQASRSRRYRTVRKTEAFDEAQPAGANGTPKDRGTDRNQHRLDAHAMLDSLSPDHRAVLVLRELEGLSYDEIAAALAIPRGTVESRLFRARNLLRERFQEYGTPRRARAARPENPAEVRHEE